jgi:quercetin dioxygenase-like cupin family protein
MNGPKDQLTEITPTLLVIAGQDQFGEERSLGISTIRFKRSPVREGDPLIIENGFRAKGGPPRHIHLEQDEWFYVVEGEFVFEIGQERYTLTRGDSLFAPRRIPHAYAHVGDGHGSVLVAFFPAGKMEAFFRKVSRTNAMPTQSPKLWSDHGMEVVGPPLPV